MTLEILSSDLVCADVCAWPNMQRLSDGRLAVVFHNSPHHAKVEDGLDMLLSADDGRSWGNRRTLFVPEAGQCRVNHAVYVGDNELQVYCGGWVLPRVRCVTPASLTLSGKELSETARRLEVPGLNPLPWIPFGNVHRGEDEALYAAMYLNLNGLTETFFMRSADDGISWKVHGRIAEKSNETAVLPLGNGRWLAAVRTENLGILQYGSEDGGRSWRFGQLVTLRRQVTGHLLLMKDGRIMLSYGNRNQGHFGVDARISEDGGKEWGEPFRLAEAPCSDCGYPSTVECEDGSLLTLYYTMTDASYEMRSVRFRLC